MIRRCDGTDLFLKDRDRNVGNCGLEFDDVEHLTICPHKRLPTEAEKQAMFDLLILGHWTKTVDVEGVKG